MPLPITCIAPVPGPSGLPIVFGYHLFQLGADGSLEHWIDSELRATVPPEGWEEYAKVWPQCADLVGQARRAPAAKLPDDERAAAKLPEDGVAARIAAAFEALKNPAV